MIREVLKSTERRVSDVRSREESLTDAFFEQARVTIGCRDSAMNALWEASEAIDRLDLDEAKRQLSKAALALEIL